MLRLWQTKDGQECRRWPALQLTAHSVVFSPDGRYLASGSWDGTVKVWEMKKVLQGEVSEPLLQLEHASNVRSVAFSPDGRAPRRCVWSGSKKDWGSEDLEHEHRSRRANVDFSTQVNCVTIQSRRSADRRRRRRHSRCGTPALVKNCSRTAITMGVWREWPSAPTAAAWPQLAASSPCIPTGKLRSWTPHWARDSQFARPCGRAPECGFQPRWSPPRVSRAWIRPLSSGTRHPGRGPHPARPPRQRILRGVQPDGRQLASASVDKTVRIWDATPLEREPTPEYLTLRGHAGVSRTSPSTPPTVAPRFRRRGRDSPGVERPQRRETRTPARAPERFGVRVAYSPTVAVWPW